MVQDQQKIEGSFLNGHPLWSTSLIAGGVARVWAVTLVSPLELIRTKMQSKKLSYQGIFKLIVVVGSLLTEFFFYLKRLEWPYVDSSEAKGFSAYGKD